MKREFIVERDGRSFVLYAGLLDEAHQQGLKSIQTVLLQIPSDENGWVAIAQATVETEKGQFMGIGDAAPNNVTAPMRTALIRMSETRAKARALRDAVNVGVAALEELGDDFEAGEAPGQGQPFERPQAIRGRNGGRERGETAAARRSGAETAVGSEPRTAGGGAGRATGSDQQATPAQVNAIYAIGRREFHWSDEEVDAHCRATFGKPTGDLTKREASELIDRLKTNPASVA